MFGLDVLTLISLLENNFFQNFASKRSLQITSDFAANGMINFGFHLDFLDMAGLENALKIVANKACAPVFPK